MPATHQPPRRDRESSGLGTAAAGIGAVLLMLVCCAGPALVAAGVLGALGGFLGNPWVIASAALLLLTAVTAAVRRRRSDRAACCPPTGSPQTTADRNHPHIPADKKGPRPR